jgi:hypothetical protein
MKRTQIRAQHDRPGACPHCGYLFECASGVGHDDAPSPGAITVCIHCAGIAIFGEGLAMRKPTLAELTALEGTEAGRHIDRLRSAIRASRPPRTGLL